MEDVEGAGPDLTGNNCLVAHKKGTSHPLQTRRALLQLLILLCCLARLPHLHLLSPVQCRLGVTFIAIFPCSDTFLYAIFGASHHAVKISNAAHDATPLLQVWERSEVRVAAKILHRTSLEDSQRFLKPDPAEDLAKQSCLEHAAKKDSATTQQWVCAIG